VVRRANDKQDLKYEQNVKSGGEIKDRQSVASKRCVLFSASTDSFPFRGMHYDEFMTWHADAGKKSDGKMSRQ